MEEKLQFLCMNRTPFVFDKFLPSGTFQKDMDGLWHVGEGTDMQQLVFETNLTRADKAFLKQVKIAV